MVEDGQDDTKQHLEDAKDDGHLHLVRIGKGQFVVSYTPDLSERIREMTSYNVHATAHTCICTCTCHVNIDMLHKQRYSDCI